MSEMVKDSRTIDVSIIMPVYNSEKYLSESIEAIIAEKRIELELIIVNDASTDKSQEIIDAYVEKDKRIKVICLEENSRQGTARNRGLDIAQGEYVLFVDSDDILHEGAIYECVNKQRSKGSDVCAFFYQRMLDDGKSRRYYSENLKQREILDMLGNKGELDIKDRELLFIHTAGVCNNLFVRKIIEDNKIRFPEKLIYEDNYFVKLYMLYVKKYAYINKIFYDYREHASSTTKKINDKSQFDRLKIEELKLNAFVERGLYEKFKDAIDFDFLRLYYLNSIGLFMRMDEVPFDKFKEMRTKVYPIIKYINKNKYYKELRKEELIKLRVSLISFRLLQLLYKIKK